MLESVFRRVRSLLRIAVCLVFCIAGARSGTSQIIIKPADLAAAVLILERAPKQDTLPCKIRMGKRAKLDFLFRYNAGFSIDCRLGEIQPGATLTALIRIIPAEHPPIMMTEEFDVPHLPSADVAGNPVSINQMQISMSGGFALGVGKYSTEVLLSAGEGRIARKKTNLRIGSEKDSRKLPLGLSAFEVAPLVNTWNRHVTTNGLRVTVLFHADSFGIARMYGWEITDLLQSLTSLLNRLPCESVRVVGFNLDRQTQVFTEDEFDMDGLTRLEKTLRQMEFVTIPVQSLQHRSWQNFLIRLARQEIEERHPDAVIILGEGGSHAWDKLPRDVLEEDAGVLSARLFYFKYFAAAGPRDGLETLIKRLHGQTYSIYSPETLARSIAKMLKDLNSADHNLMGSHSDAQAGR